MIKKPPPTPFLVHMVGCPVFPSNWVVHQVVEVVAEEAVGPFAVGPEPAAGRRRTYSQIAGASLRHRNLLIVTARVNLLDTKDVARGSGPAPIVRADRGEGWVTHPAEAFRCSSWPAEEGIRHDRTAAVQRKAGGARQWDGLAGDNRMPWEACQEPTYHRNRRACRSRPSRRHEAGNLHGGRCQRLCQHGSCARRTCCVFDVSVEACRTSLQPRARLKDRQGDSVKRLTRYCSLRRWRAEHHPRWRSEQSQNHGCDPYRDPSPRPTRAQCQRPQGTLGMTTSTRSRSVPRHSGQ